MASKGFSQDAPRRVRQRKQDARGRWLAKSVEERQAITLARTVGVRERNERYRQNVDALRTWALQQPGVAGNARKLITVDQLCIAYLGQLVVQNRIERLGAGAGRGHWREWIHRANEVLRRMSVLGFNDGPMKL